MEIKIYVQPGAKRPGWAGLHDGIPKLKVRSAPVDGAANDSVVSFLATALKISQSEIMLKSGHTSRRKVITIPDSSLPIWNMITDSLKS